MNKLNLLIAGLMTFAGCTGAPKQSDDKTAKETVTAQTDPNRQRCDTSAGYTWSDIKNECIQVFNEGFRLNPVESAKGKEVVSAFVLSSDDQTKVELFLPDSTDRSVLLNKVDKLIFENGTYKYDANKSLLYADGKLVYKGNVE